MTGIRFAQYGTKHAHAAGKLRAIPGECGRGAGGRFRAGRGATGRDGGG